MQPFCGEIFIEDQSLGKKSVYALIREYDSGNLSIELHNANFRFVLLQVGLKLLNHYC
jgi:hypothetical protein